MTTFILLSLLIAIPALLLFTAVSSFKKVAAGTSPRRASKVNFATFGILILLVAMMSVSVFATEPESQTEEHISEEAAEPTEQNDMSKGMGLLAAGLVTGLAGIGGGIAVAAGAPAAIAATSEDPKSFGKSIIFVALGESIALYGVVIAILILQKV